MCQTNILLYIHTSISREMPTFFTRTNILFLQTMYHKGKSEQTWLHELISIVHLHYLVGNLVLLPARSKCVQLRDSVSAVNSN